MVKAIYFVEMEIILQITMSENCIEMCLIFINNKHTLKAKYFIFEWADKRIMLLWVNQISRFLSLKCRALV